MDAQVLVVIVQAVGTLVTIAVVLGSNARRHGRLEEHVRGLGRTMDNDRETNRTDHERFDRELAALRKFRGAGAD